MRLRWSTIILGTALIAAVSCGDSFTTLTPGPTPSIPVDFITFTDETETYSIRYPQTWELSMSQVELLDEMRNKEIQSNQDNAIREIDISASRVLFLAGLPVSDKFDPQLSIIAESLPRKTALHIWRDGGLKGDRAMHPDLLVNDERPALIGKDRAHLRDIEFESPENRTGFDRQRQVILVTTSDNGTVGWRVACAFAETKSEETAEVCELVVQSFRLLK